MIKAPFPWFGGKSRAADLIWSRLGADCGNYVEPFLGSAAVWLNRPAAFDGWATLNDKDGNVANFWRAMQADPEAVAAAANYSVSEADLHARHLWLVNNVPKLTPRLMADPEYFEARTAGWWAWGVCLWIGGGWCSDKILQRLPHLTGGHGFLTKKLFISKNKLQQLTAKFCELSDRLKLARITCGDWQRVCSVNTMILHPAYKHLICGVLLDPPYSTTKPVYANDGREISATVRDWCLQNGDNPRLRIALCGHAGEHDLPGWECVQWQPRGGYQGADDRERIWFSPACIKPQRDLFDL